MVNKKDLEMEFALELIEKAPAPMSLLDPDGERIYVNEAFGKVYGYSK